jgi:hypothetical protein
LKDIRALLEERWRRDYISEKVGDGCIYEGGRFTTKSRRHEGKTFDGKNIEPGAEAKSKR